MNVTGSFPLKNEHEMRVEREDAVALRWWPDAQLRRLASELQELCNAWMDAWALPHSASTAAPVDIVASKGLSRADASDSAGEYWMALPAPSNEEQAWWTVKLSVEGRGFDVSEVADIAAPDDRAVALVRAALFGSPRGALPVLTDSTQSRVADDVAAEAVEDWRVRLSKWIGGTAADRTDAPVIRERSSLPVRLAQPWSGAVWLSIDWGGHHFVLVMDFSCATRLLSSRDAVSTDAENTVASAGAGLVPVLTALSGETLCVSAELSPIELDLGALTGLRIGDVVRIPHALETPLLVRVNDGTPLFQGFLGRLDEHKALELQRADSAQ